jgi:hypothetical protein
MLANRIHVLAWIVAACGCASAPPTRGLADFEKLAAGVTTQADAISRLGPPALERASSAGERQSWGYRYRAAYEPRVFWLEWSASGTLHSTSDAPDLEAGRYRWP